MDQIPDFLQIKDLETTVNSITDFIKNEVFEKFHSRIFGLKLDPKIFKKQKNTFPKYF